MSFRTVIITKHCKLSYKNGALVVRGDDIQKIHLSEIHTLIIDSTMALVTSHLLCELIKNKTKVIFCDEKRNPISELMPYYDYFQASKSLKNQINWSKNIKDKVFQHIIKQKLLQQSQLLNTVDNDRAQMLMSYSNNVQIADITNREGHGAKVYFYTLFGSKFTRDNMSEINKALDYGYAIILSCFNKYITSLGYITQLGIHHKNDYNHFNLTSDFMEPYRVLVDRIVKKNEKQSFNSDYKFKLVDVLNEDVVIDGKHHKVANAIKIYVRSLFNALNCGDVSVIKDYYYED